ncbi:MAG: hypothetical protein DMG49_05055 [Acidobacteria bacterium]|nr:MAG: hypothetical protein DMG49_05055 [Acidobacteriota bacterium]
MKDCRHRSGVSTATVSQVINKTRYASDETKSSRRVSVVSIQNFLRNLAWSRTIANGYCRG